MVEWAQELFDFKIEYNRIKIDNGETSYKYFYEVAQINAITGDVEAAYDFLKLAYEHGWPEYIFAYLDPSFATMVEDDRFLELIEKSQKTVQQKLRKIVRVNNIKVG